MNGLNEEKRIKSEDKSIDYKISQYQEGYQILQQMVSDLQEEVYSTASKINVEIRKTESSPFILYMYANDEFSSRARPSSELKSESCWLATIIPILNFLAGFALVFH